MGTSWPTAWWPVAGTLTWIEPDEESERRARDRRLTQAALAWAVARSNVAPPLCSPPALKARYGYQDAPRLPCYRAVRTR